ncbi:DUF1684 domain-containing protein [Kribbella lupini]|uniref:DUF1684 domain-containing protein n=1 Tax=Kribbella lupini TaxID=291602 RepID=A0ABN2C863_9ACTN
MTVTTQEDWHTTREQELATKYGWLTVSAFDWLTDTPARVPGLPGTWWTADGQAHVRAGGELTLHGEPLVGTTSAGVPEGASLSWLLYGEVLVELLVRDGRYALRQRDPSAATRTGFTGVPTYPVDPAWVVTGHYTPYNQAERTVVDTARPDLRAQLKLVGAVHLALGGTAYELAVTAGGDGRLNLAFHDKTNGDETARWRTLTAGELQRDGSVQLDFNRAINPPSAFTAHGICPAPPAGNRLALPVTAGEKRPR